MAKRGLGVEGAQAFLGHRDPATTLIYYKITDERLRKVIRALDAKEGSD